MPAKKVARARTRWRSRIRAGVTVMLVVGAIAGGAYLVVRYREISVLIEQRHAALSSSIYSAPHAIRTGDDLVRSHLLDRLRALSYSEVATVEAPGQYSKTASAFSIYLRGFQIGKERYPETLVQVRLAGRKIVAVDRVSGSAAPPRLEPETIGRLVPGAAAERVEVHLDDQKAYLVDGLLATEDQAFYYHPGINPVRIVKAALENIRTRRLAQGASTLTQQLARTFLERYERSFQRKIDELAVALVLEIRLRKAEILERYINDVSMGAYAGAPIHGMPQAARYFFNRDLNQVTPAEAATLIGMVKAPTNYDPRRHPEASKRRRNIVLGIMKRNGVIDAATWAAAIKEPLKLSPTRGLRRAPYFSDFVIASLRDVAGVTGDLSGLKVYTTLDTETQSAAADAATTNLDKLEKSHRRLRRNRKDPRLQTSAVVLDARSGAIRAMVGGRSYQDSQFNRATSGLRQPGSAFKPIVYLAAMDPSRARVWPPLTLASLLPDEPLSFNGWAPENYERSFAGPVTAVHALSESLNVPTAYLGNRLGPELLVRTAHDLGISQELDPVLPISMGTEETTLLDLTSAYQVFANAGARMPAYSIEAVIDGEGREVYRHKDERRVVMQPEVAYLVTGALQTVLQSGTGASAASLGLDLPAAGKTGTTQDYRDAYFIGYTPDVVCGVWVGFDAPQNLGLTGAQAALPPWVRIVKAAASRRDFDVPNGIVLKKIDPQTGAVATSACPSSLTLPFLTGTAPTSACRLHGGGDLIAAVPDHYWGGMRNTTPFAAKVTEKPSGPGVVFDRVGTFFKSLFGR